MACAANPQQGLGAEYAGCFRPCHVFDFWVCSFHSFYMLLRYFAILLKAFTFFVCFSALSRDISPSLLHVGHHVPRIFHLLFAFLHFPPHFTSMFPEIIELIHLSVPYDTFIFQYTLPFHFSWRPWRGSLFPSSLTIVPCHSSLGYYVWCLFIL